MQELLAQRLQQVLSFLNQGNPGATHFPVAVLFKTRLQLTGHRAASRSFTWEPLQQQLQHMPRALLALTPSREHILTHASSMTEKGS